jgi:hypothetical protein
MNLKSNNKIFIMLFDTFIFVQLSILDDAILLMIKHNFLFDLLFFLC